MKYKLVCSDLDDTLLGKNCAVTPALKEAIRRYEEEGGRFRIVTGRMTVGALPICRALALQGELASYQGAIVSDIRTGEVYRRTVVNNADAVEVGRFIEENGWYYQTYVGDAFYTQNATDFSHLYMRLSNAPYVETGCRLSDYILQNDVCPPKLLLNAPVEEVPAVRDALRARFSSKFLINVSKPYIVEMVPKGVNKGVAVAFLAEKYGLKPEEVLCIGDSENDVTMLTYGTGVAVANASAAAKNVADVVAPRTCDEDAVAWVLDTLTR